MCTSFTAYILKMLHIINNRNDTLPLRSFTADCASCSKGFCWTRLLSRAKESQPKKKHVGMPPGLWDPKPFGIEKIQIRTMKSFSAQRKNVKSQCQPSLLSLVSRDLTALQHAQASFPITSLSLSKQHKYSKEPESHTSGACLLPIAFNLF